MVVGLEHGRVVAPEKDVSTVRPAPVDGCSGGRGGGETARRRGRGGWAPRGGLGGGTAGQAGDREARQHGPVDEPVEVHTATGAAGSPWSLPSHFSNACLSPSGRAKERRKVLHVCGRVVVAVAGRRQSSSLLIAMKRASADGRKVHGPQSRCHPGIGKLRPVVVGAQGRIGHDDRGRGVLDIRWVVVSCRRGGDAGVEGTATWP